MTKESIIEKIRKLLALAGNNPNEAERQRATEAAERLMSEHNLAASQVHTGGQPVTHEVSGLSGAGWRGSAAVAVGRLYDTKAYRSGGKIGFIGTPENIAVSMSIFAWLVDSIWAQARREYQSPSMRTSFCNGAAAELCKRSAVLAESRKKATPATMNGQEQAKHNQLVVVHASLQKLNDDYGRQNLNLSKGRTNSYSASGEAFANGSSYGNSVGLNKQVKGEPAKRLTCK